MDDTQIYIARHGQDRDNHKGILNGRRDEPLTDLGILQAKNLAENIANINVLFDVVLTSPLQRASSTAKIVTERLGITDPIVDPDLVERDFGVMTGKFVK